MLIQRRLLGTLLGLLPASRAILVEGPPRSGKSVLAAQLRRALGAETPLLSAASPGGRALLEDPGSGLASLLPRGARALLIDEARRGDAARLEAALALPPSPEGEEAGWTPPPLVLFGGPFGGAAPSLPRLELGPLGLAEVGSANRGLRWLRGGFPEAFFAPSEREAFAWLGAYAASLAEEGFARAGLPWAPDRHRALLAMIAEAQASPFNENEAARALGVSRPTVLRSLRALEEVGVLRLLPSLPSPAGRRRLRSPALLIRDSGLCHALLGIGSLESLLGSRRLAASWEAFGIEEAIGALGPGLRAARLPLAAGKGLDLVLCRGERAVAAAIFSFARRVPPGRGPRLALEELGLKEGWIVLPEAEEGRPAGGAFREIGLSRFLERLGSL